MEEQRQNQWSEFFSSSFILAEAFAFFGFDFSFFSFFFLLTLFECHVSRAVGLLFLTASLTFSHQASRLSRLSCHIWVWGIFHSGRAWVLW